MAYDLHIVRTKNWLEASKAPITKQDVDALSDDAGAVTRYYMITWRGQPPHQSFGERVTGWFARLRPQRRLLLSTTHYHLV